jgi:hypothetical protein
MERFSVTVLERGRAAMAVRPDRESDPSLISRIIKLGEVFCVGAPAPVRVRTIIDGRNLTAGNQMLK